MSRTSRGIALSTVWLDSEILLFKLECLRIKGIELEWFQNYLNNRWQCVQYGVVLSEKQHIAPGVNTGAYTVYYLCQGNHTPRVNLKKKGSKV